MNIIWYNFIEKNSIIMTIQEYSNKINNLRIEEQIFHLSNDTDLETTVSKILQRSSETYFTLQDFFEEADESVMLNNIIVKLFSDRLGLLFSSEKEAGNLCFANYADLRPEFRQNFTPIELLDYVYAFVHTSFYKQSLKIAIPSDSFLFWKLVKTGVCLRK